MIQVVLVRLSSMVYGLMTFCFKGNLLTRISETLNEGNTNETKFRVFVKKLKRNNSTNIIVSWKPFLLKEKTEKSDDKSD